MVYLIAGYREMCVWNVRRRGGLGWRGLGWDGVGCVPALFSLRTSSLIAV
jgi:hypothetical protein